MEDSTHPRAPVNSYVLCRTFCLNGYRSPFYLFLEIESFVADTSGEAFEKVVDRLLASRHYGERWGRHWLDVARYAESMGRTRNYAFPYAWRYRDYVIAAFNKDKPYDRFVREQIAGSPSAVVAGTCSDDRRAEH